MIREILLTLVGRGPDPFGAFKSDAYRIWAVAIRYAFWAIVVWAVLSNVDKFALAFVVWARS